MCVAADLVRLRLINERAYRLLDMGLRLERGEIRWWGPRQLSKELGDLILSNDGDLVEEWFYSSIGESATRESDILACYFAAWSAADEV